jgi:hypothetical protein
VLDDPIVRLSIQRPGLHREERDALVDDDELQRRVVDDACLLALFDELPDCSDHPLVVVHQSLVQAARDKHPREQLEAFGVLARLDRVRGLREDEELPLGPRLQLLEAPGDRRRLAQHLDEVQGVGLGAAGAERRRQERDRTSGILLEVDERRAMRLEEQPDRVVGSDGGVVRRSARLHRREPAPDEPVEHVVDPLPW